MKNKISEQFPKSNEMLKKGEELNINTSV